MNNTPETDSPLKANIPELMAFSRKLEREQQRTLPQTMSETPETQCGTPHYYGCACHEKGWHNKWQCAVEMAARAAAKLDQATERLTHAEILLSDLSSGYWRAVLNDQDPSGEGLMGERVAQYWARYCEDKPTTTP